MEPPVLYAWILVGAGVIIWWTGQQMKSPQSVGGKSSGGATRVLSVIGLALFGLGMYAGFRGPVTMGSVTLGPFPFAHFIQASQTGASEYAKSYIQISSRPAPGWRGGSKTTLECTVKNTGDKALSRLFVRLDASNGQVVELRLSGPFPAKQTTTALLDVPANANRAYFAAPGIQLANIVGARF